MFTKGKKRSATNSGHTRSQKVYKTMFCSSGTPTSFPQMSGVTEIQLKNVEDKFTKILLQNETQLEKNVTDVETLSKKVDVLLKGIEHTESVIEQSQMLLTTHQNDVHEKLGVVGANVQNFIDDA